MATAVSDSLKLKPLELLLQTSDDANCEDRYNRILQGIALLTCELTQTLAGLQAQMTNDLEFIVRERADLVLQRAAIPQDKSKSAELAQAVPKAFAEAAVQVNATRVGLGLEKANPIFARKEVDAGVHVTATRVGTGFEKANAITSPQEVYALAATRPWQCSKDSTPSQPPTQLPRVKSQGWVTSQLTTKFADEYSASQMQTQSLGQLPAWLNTGELPRGANTRVCKTPEPQRPKEFHSLGITTENDARAAELRRAWLVTKGEQAHRFMMDKRENERKDEAFLDDSDDDIAGAGSSGVAMPTS